MRRTLTLAAAGTLALGLAACSPADPDDSAVEDELGLDAEGEQGADAEPGTGEAVPGGGPLPGPGECVDLEPVTTGDEEDGVLEWTVGDAGVILTTTEGEGLILQGTQPAGGWESEVLAEDESSASVEFRAEDVSVVVEITDGGESGEVCGR